MKLLSHPLMTAALLALVAGCGDSSGGAGGDLGAGSHTHADGSTHADHVDDADDDPGDAHDEVSLGTAMVGGMSIELAQGHGAVRPGKESHLVVKLPYADRGATVVRAWIGSEDRTLSFVGRGEYAAAHDDYDIHAVAPDPLPPDAMWWIEIEKPDGTKVVGAASPIMD